MCLSRHIMKEKNKIPKSPYIENTFQQVAISITRRRALWPGLGRRGVGLFVSVFSLLHFSSLSLFSPLVLSVTLGFVG
jgi:hypothetical protein